MRSFVVLVIAALFLTTVASGLMAFLLPFDIGITRIHAVAAPMLAVFVGWHVYHNRRVLVRCFSSQCRKQLLATTGLLSVTAVALYLDAFPVSAWMNQSYEQRRADVVFRPSAEVVTRRIAGRIEIHRHDARVDIRVTATLASDSRENAVIWMEDDQGRLLQTLYLSQQLMYTDEAAADRSAGRRQLLPVWWHRRQAVQDRRAATQGPDAISTATPTEGFDFDTLVESQQPRFQLMMEIAPASGASQVYSALVDLDRIKRHYLMDLHGLGTPRGTLSYDLSALHSHDLLADRVLISIDDRRIQTP